MARLQAWEGPDAGDPSGFVWRASHVDQLGTVVTLGTLVTLGTTPDAGEPDQVDAAPVVL